METQNSQNEEESKSSRNSSESSDEPTPCTINPMGCCHNKNCSCCTCMLRIGCVVIGILEIILSVLSYTSIRRADKSLKKNKIFWSDQAILPLAYTEIGLQVLAGILLIIGAILRVKFLCLVNAVLIILAILVQLFKVSLVTYLLVPLLPLSVLGVIEIALTIVWVTTAISVGVEIYFVLCAIGLFTQIRAGFEPPPPPPSPSDGESGSSSSGSSKVLDESRALIQAPAPAQAQFDPNQGHPMWLAKPRLTNEYEIPKIATQTKLADPNVDELNSGPRSTTTPIAPQTAQPIKPDNAPQIKKYRQQLANNGPPVVNSRPKIDPDGPKKLQ